MLPLALLTLWVIPTLCQDAVPCAFNPMCSCRMGEQNALREISCLGVPFSKLPGKPITLSYLPPLRDQLWIGPDIIWNKDFIGAELLAISKVCRQLMLYTCFLTKVKLDLKFSDSPKLDLLRDHYGHCL